MAKWFLLLQTRDADRVRGHRKDLSRPELFEGQRQRRAALVYDQHELLHRRGRDAATARAAPRQGMFVRVRKAANKSLKKDTIQYLQI